MKDQKQTDQDRTRTELVHPDLYLQCICVARARG